MSLVTLSVEPSLPSVSLRLFRKCSQFRCLIFPFTAALEFYDRGWDPLVYTFGEPRLVYHAVLSCRKVRVILTRSAAPSTPPEPHTSTLYVCLLHVCAEGSAFTRLHLAFDPPALQGQGHLLPHYAQERPCPHGPLPKLELRPPRRRVLHRL